MTAQPKTMAYGEGQISYHEMGEGEPLFMLHGSGPGVTAWMNFGGNLPVFAEHYHCIAPDLPGYGGSTGIPGDPIGEAAKAVLHMMDQMGIGSAYLLGNSYGAMVAARFAADYPDRIRKMVTIGGIGVPLFSTFPYEGIARLSEFVENPTREQIVAWLRSMVYDPAIVTEELIETRLATASEPAAQETNKRMYSRAVLDAIAGAMRGPDAVQGFAHFPKIQAPTLMTWGRDDRVNPLDIALLPMRLIPNCELHVFPRCGHWAMIEQKDAFEQVVLGFLQRD
ncbi:alpha/beta hydrolase [Croceicoccus estronivorus]|uniref:alpha/beta fold hydrolase n=1 Tax=Croceicoccus estronivorus TaxID=1172626 RepID=UPI000833E63B|nr:alpha/beta fold hydrolase [Croceicoccus estronivorus]OCC24961.1 alpha/beta hydrolase [Croceicoccus estronivorus]